MNPKKVLLLVGSPKGAKSTSESLGTYLLDQLDEKGFQTETNRINPALKSNQSREKLLLAGDNSDLLIIAFPLYVDSLPSQLIKAMELIAERRKAMEDPKKPQLLAIINSGFPEAAQNDTALAICRRFAKESAIEWIGGLALGGGAAIDGRSLDEAGGMVRNVKKSLDLTAEALAEGKPLPQDAIDLMAKRLAPTRMYLFMGNLGWKRQAKKNGVRKSLDNRPYQEAE